MWFSSLKTVQFNNFFFCLLSTNPRVTFKENSTMVNNPFPKIKTRILNPIYPGGSTRPPLFVFFELGSSPTFLTHLRLKVGLLYHCIQPKSSALWTAYNKSNPIAQFLQRNFAQIFAQGICTVSVFLEINISVFKILNVFTYLNSLGQVSKMYILLQLAQYSHFLR